MSKRTSRITACLGGAALLLTVSCSQGTDTVESIAEPVVPANVVATVGERVVTVEQMTRELGIRQEQRRPVNSIDEVLADVVLKEALVQRAKNLGLHQDPEIRRELDRLLIGKLLDRELETRTAKATVEDEELRAYYQAHLSTYTIPAQFRLAMLQVKGAKGMSPEKRQDLIARISQAREQILAGRAEGVNGLSGVARDYSDDLASRHRDGDIGWWNAADVNNHLPLELMTQGVALAVGEVSEVLEIGDSFYLVAKTDTRPERVTPFESIAASLRRTLLAERRDQAREAYFQSVRLEAGITIYSNHLAQVDFPASSSSSSPITPPAPFGVSGNL